MPSGNQPIEHSPNGRRAPLANPACPARSPATCSSTRPSFVGVQKILYEQSTRVTQSHERPCPPGMPWPAAKLRGLLWLPSSGWQKGQLQTLKPHAAGLLVSVRLRANLRADRYSERKQVHAQGHAQGLSQARVQPQVPDLQLCAACHPPTAPTRKN